MAINKTTQYITNPNSIPIDSSTGDAQALGDALDNRAVDVDDYTELKSLSVSGLRSNQTANVNISSRKGSFVWLSGDRSSSVSSDPQEGVWVPPGEDVTGASGAWMRRYSRWEGVSAEWFGFDESGTHADNKAALQASVDYTPGTVRVGDYPDGVNCGSGIQLKRGVTIEMGSTYAGGALLGGLQGDGADAIFLTDDYVIGGPNSPSSIREITLRGITAANTGGQPVIKLWSSPNGTFDKCRMSTTDAPCIDARFSFRLAIIGGKYQSSWTTSDSNNFTLTAYDNCNGFWITPDTVISGGSNGGGVDVGRSQKICIDGIYESCGAANAIRIAGANPIAQGSCRAVKLAGYIEACHNPIDLGETDPVRGVKLGEMFINNEFISAPPGYAIRMSRVKGLEGLGTISAIGEGTEPFLRFVLGSGSIILSPENIYIDADISNFASNVNNPLTAGPASVAFNSGRISINGDVLGGNAREFVTSTISADAGYATSGIETVGFESGIIDSVEIVEKSGDLTGCDLKIGCPADIDFNMSFSVNSAVYSSQYADITDQLINTYMRQGELLTINASAGSGTGTFRVKLKYRI